MNKFKITFITFLLLIISGCGGGSNPLDKTKKADNIGVYEDAPISGIEYSCGKYSGVTNSAGEFKYEFNKSCEFSFFKHKIDSFEADTTEYKNIHLQIKNQKAPKFLAMLDVDGNLDNGFNINYDIAKKYFDKNLTNLSDAEIEEALNSYAKDLNFKRKSENEIETILKKHQEKRVKKILSGKTLWFAFRICTNCGYDKNATKKKEYIVYTEKITFNEDLTQIKREWSNGDKFSDAINLDGNIVNFDTISLQVVAVTDMAIKVKIEKYDETYYEWYYFSKDLLEKKIKEGFCDLII